MAYCFTLGSAGHAFARGMLPWGIIEDPATGSAAGSCGAYLVRHGKLRAGEQLKILQGVEMKRPSNIEVRLWMNGKDYPCARRLGRVHPGRTHRAAERSADLGARRVRKQHLSG